MRRRRRFDLFILREVLGLRNQVRKLMPPHSSFPHFTDQTRREAILKFDTEYTNGAQNIISFCNIRVSAVSNLFPLIVNTPTEVMHFY